MDFDKEIFQRCSAPFAELNVCQKKYSNYYGQQSEDSIFKAMEEGMETWIMSCVVFNVLFKSVLQLNFFIYENLIYILDILNIR